MRLFRKTTKQEKIAELLGLAACKFGFKGVSHNIIKYLSFLIIIIFLEVMKLK